MERRRAHRFTATRHLATYTYNEADSDSVDRLNQSPGQVAYNESTHCAGMGLLMRSVISYSANIHIPNLVDSFFVFEAYREPDTSGRWGGANSSRLERLMNVVGPSPTSQTALTSAAHDPTGEDSPEIHFHPFLR
ncbi:hypothetical protein AG1IA_06727 [Rhizoctonia solani AG-1 IA]|uniref:Uncharacterized protein n=1 Tax=Thanatephorus cucumeris (strain AG1-IA) TaxID=983506 RepID=L8WR20_THACA|nr:hypothetical protein AG1IA_06727 [Rhizoctonia solani AG-1 IA]